MKINENKLGNSIKVLYLCRIQLLITKNNSHENN